MLPVFTSASTYTVSAAFGREIVVCGAGSIGSGVIDLLLTLDKRLVVIERTPDTSVVERAREQRFDLLTGDASRDTTLDLCNLSSAHGLIALTNVDTLNLEIALGGRVTSQNDVKRWEALGVTRLVVSPWKRSPEAIEGLRAFAEFLPY